MDHLVAFFATPGGQELLHAFVLLAAAVAALTSAYATKIGRQNREHLGEVHRDIKEIKANGSAKPDPE